MRRSVFLFLLLGCGGPGVVAVDEGFEVRATTLDFGRAWCGHPVVRGLEILSRSRRRQEISVEAQAPFAAAPAVLSLGGGEAAEVDVTFAPAAPGLVRGVLRVGEVEVALLGEAVAPPACAPRDECHRARFDAALGQCVDEALEDGTACAGGGCLEGGRCLGGACLGLARSCDDANACTRDACEPGVGCRHLDVSSECPAAPCQVAVCDAAQGCGLAPAVDGTSCGAMSCLLADVCLAGRCVALVPPDGATCEEASPCQARGVCQAQQCVRPPASALAPLWEYAPAGHLDFRGVSDGQGNLYWVEWLEGESRTGGAVSFSKDGVQRFRGAELEGAGGPVAAQLFDEGRFVYATEGGQVVAVDGASGAVLWTQALQALVDPVPVQVTRLASDGQGRLWLQGMNFNKCGVAPADNANVPAYGSVLLGLDARTGAVAVALSVPSFTPLVLDAAGAVHLVELSGVRASYSPAGQPRFLVPGVGSQGLVSAHRGRVVTAANAAYAAVDGAPLVGPASDSFVDEAALQLDGRVVRLRAPLGCFPAPPGQSVEVALYDATALDGRALRAVSGPGGPIGVSGSSTDLALADGELVLVAGTPAESAGQPALLGVRLDGGAGFTCALAPAVGGAFAAFFPQVAFTGDRFALVEQVDCPSCLVQPPPLLRVFATAPLQPARAGWVARGGTPGQAFRPR